MQLKCTKTNKQTNLWKLYWLKIPAIEQWASLQYTQPTPLLDVHEQAVIQNLPYSIYQHIINTYFQTGMVWIVKVQPLMSSGSTCSSNSTCNSHSGLQCTKPVQPVATQLFILVQLLQLLMQLLMSQMSLIYTRGWQLRQVTDSDPSVSSAGSFTFGKPESLWSKSCGLQVQKMSTCVSAWNLGFPLQLFASETSNMKEDNINTSKGYKSSLIWKPRLTVKEGIFRK